MAETSDTPYEKLPDTQDTESVAVQKPKSWRSKYNFLWFFYNNVFCACVSFSIVMPSIYIYILKHGGSDNFFATVLFIYSLGELVGALAFGYMHNYCSTKTTLYTCISLGFVGSAMYFIADYAADTPALALIFAARTLQGLWTGGQQSLEQAYVSEVVDKEDNLRINAEVGMAAVSGFIFGPIIGLALSLIDIHFWGVVNIDAYTSPGYIQTIATLIMLIQTAIRFEEVPHDQRKYRNPPPEREVKRPDRIGVMTIFILCLIFFNVLAVQETVTTPLVCDHDERFTESFDWSVTGSYVMYAGSGLFTIVAFILMHLTSGKIDDRVFCVIGLIIGIVGFVLMIDFEERVIWYPAFFVGYALISMSFPIGRIVTLSMLSKIIGPAKAGGYMGWYLCIGAIARCVGPYWAVNALLISVRVCFGSTTIFMIISMIILWLTWKNCRPHPEFTHEDDPPIEAKSEKTE